MFQHLDYIDVITAFSGFLLRWLFFLDSRKKRLLSEGKEFSVKNELKGELMLVIASSISTIGFLFGVPEALENFNKIIYWNSIVAMGCGMSSVDITRFFFNNVPTLLNIFKGKALKKLGEKDNSSEQA